jgi:hypothetical protein
MYKPAREFRASLSHRVAMARKFLMRQLGRSMTLRHL